MSITVTATQGGSTSNGMSLRVYVLTSATLAGTPATGSQGGTAAHRAAVSSTTGSKIYAGYVNANGNTSFTAQSGTTPVDNIADATNSCRYGTGTASGSGSSVTIGASAPTNQGAAAALEVLTPGSEDASAPAVATTTSAKTVTTASFTPPAGALLVAIVKSDGGASTTTMTVSDTGGGYTWTEQIKGNGSGDGYAGIWTASVPSSGNTSTGSVAMPRMALSGTDTETETSSGSVAAPRMALSGTVGQQSKATGSMALPRMNLSGTDTETETSSGSVAIPPMALSGTATVASTASGSVALPTMALAGTDTETEKATGSIALPRMALSGIVGQQTKTSGSLALPRMALHGAEAHPPRVPLHLGGTVTEEDVLGGTAVRYVIDGTAVSTSPVYDGTAISSTAVIDGTAVLGTIDGTAAIAYTIDGSLTQLTRAGTLDEWTMTPINIVLAEFNDEQLAVTVTADSAPLDLTDATSVDAFFKTAAGVSDSDGSTIKLSSTTSGVTITDAAAGDVTVAIPASDLASAGIGFWRLDVVDGDGNRNTAIYGTVTVTLL